MIGSRFDYSCSMPLANRRDLQGSRIRTLLSGAPRRATAQLRMLNHSDSLLDSPRSGQIALKS